MVAVVIFLIVSIIGLGIIGICLLVLQRNSHPIKERSFVLFISQSTLIIFIIALAFEAIFPEIYCFYDILVVNSLIIFVFTSYGIRYLLNPYFLCSFSIF